ncbi:MAG: redox-sensing transcriptional repressor Rex [Acidobacteriota bacterium]
MDLSPIIHNRLCLYLRSLRRLQEEDVHKISSQGLAERFQLSAPQIRKDLAQLGEFGIRGVGYDVDELTCRLSSILRLDRVHPVVMVGMGNLGRALARYLGFNHGAFRVVAGVDKDPDKVGLQVAGFQVRPSSELKRVVQEHDIEVGVLTVPPDAAQGNYNRLVEAGVSGVLNFSPARVQAVPEVPLKDIDLRIYLEQLAYFLPESDSEKELVSSAS